MIEHQINRYQISDISNAIFQASKIKLVVTFDRYEDETFSSKTFWAYSHVGDNVMLVTL